MRSAHSMHLAALATCSLLAATAAPQNLLRGQADDAVLKSMEFRSVGPAVRSGRIADIAVVVDPKSPAGTRLGTTVYIATAGSGIWKTTNAGKTWSPTFDATGVHSTGAVAVAATDPNIVWAGSGESNNLRSSSWGNGIYRSTDAGRTWSNMGLRGSQHIARIRIHPSDPNIVYVAAMGPLWTSGGERGFYKTTDGGKTWKNTLSRGPFTGVTDIVLDPRNPNTIYAATYQRERKAYSFVAGGPESGIFKSADGGETWSELKEGIPSGDKGRIGLDLSQSQPDTLYATIHADDGGVFRSDNGGAAWTRQSTLQSIPWFFGQIRVDPRNPDRVYHLGVSISASTNAGRNWNAIAQRTHADHHAMWIDPNDSDHMIIGNDGGLYYSHDGGRTWDFAVNLPVSQFYAVAVDMRQPYWIYGGTQDNGTWMGPSQTRVRTGIMNSDWVRAGGGDGFYSAIDPKDPYTAYVESQNGALLRLDVLLDERKSIRPPQGAGERHRYNWSAPLLISPHDHKTLYFAANYLFRSRDRGDSWERLGGDLTRDLNRDRLPIMGLSGPGGLGRHDGVADFGNISTLDESPRRAGVLAVGTDDGLVQVSRDGGKTWKRIERFPGVPEMAYVSRVVWSAHEEGTLYVTFDHHRDNDFKPYVLKSTDFGDTFTSIASNLPQEGSVHVIREHPRNKNLLFVGTEFGVFTTIDGGRTWAQMTSGLPPVAAHDMVIHPRDNDLVVATHSRGIFILEDLNPLVGLAEAATRHATVFAPKEATIISMGSGPSVPGHRSYEAPNPPNGAVISYMLGQGAGEVSLVILDGSGTVVRNLRTASSPGLHRVVWDLRMNAPAPQAPSQPVFPGNYRAQILIQGRVVSEAPVRVQRDPLLRLSDAEYRDLHASRMKADRIARDAHALATRLEEARKGLGEPDALQGDRKGLYDEMGEAIGRLRGGERAGRGRAAGQPILPRVTSVGSALGSTNFMPTPAQRGELDAVERDFTQARQQSEALLQRARTAGGGKRAA
jgi:photosystem II stability/assembly factor-like uncharacterized protein